MKKFLVLLFVSIILIGSLPLEKVYAEDSNIEEIEFESVAPLPIQTGTAYVFGHLDFDFGNYYVNYRVKITADVERNQTTGAYRISRFLITPSTTDGYVPSGKTVSYDVYNLYYRINNGKVYVNFTIKGTLGSYTDSKTHNNIVVMTIN